jgi:hypothetical protein
MPRTHRARPIVLILLGVLAILALAGTAVYAAGAAKPDFALGVNPTSTSVQPGGTASYGLTVTGSDGFTGTVSLSAATSPASPDGLASSLAPSSVALTASRTSGSGALSVRTTASTSPGSYAVTVTGTSGRTKHSLGLTLNVSRASGPAFTLTATPASASATVPAGSTAVYTLAITRAPGFTGGVALTVEGNRPAGTTATFSPNPATGTSASLQVTTGTATPAGSYPLHVVGSASVNGTTQYQYAPTQLTVSAPTGPAQPFTISGNLPGQLAPGAPAQPLNLALANPNKKSLAISGLTVTITRIVRATGVTAPCGTSDYSVTQYGGYYPLTLAGGRSATLSQLGVPVSGLPRVQMLDTRVSQDGCKGATLTLAYSGSGRGN